MSNFLIRTILSIGLVMVIFLKPAPVLGGKLGDFEHDATREEKKDNSHAEKDEDENHDGFLNKSLTDFVFEAVGFAFFSGGYESYARVSDLPQSELDTQVKKRERGEPAIPFLRLDFNYQNVESDVAGFDGRVEVGYGPIGLQYRQTHYRENDPSDELDVMQVNGLYRMSFSEFVEIDLGLGALILDGKDRNSGFSVTTPILVLPTEYLGFQFRPSWGWIAGNQISDYDLGILITKSVISLQAGYRWLDNGISNLKGPYVGTSLHF